MLFKIQKYRFPLVKKSTINKKKIIKIVLILIWVLGLALIIQNLEFLTNKEALINEINKLGTFKYFAMILIYALQDIFFFAIPGILVASISGYIFGYFLGAFLGSIGFTIAATTYFLLSKKLFAKKAKKILKKHKHNKYVKYHINNNHTKALTLLRMWPFTIHQVITIAASITKMSLRKFILITLIFTFPY